MINATEKEKPVDFLEFIEKTNSTNSLDDLFDIFRVSLQGYGYDRFIFSLMTDHIELGLDAGHGLLQNYPDDWMKHYVAKGYEDCDPVRCFMFARNGPFIWDELPLVQDLTKRQKDCLYGGAEAGLNNGAAVSLRGANNEIAGVGAGSSDKANLDKNAPWILNALSQQFYIAYCGLMHNENVEKEVIYLSDREREILKWVAKGKSSWDIGTMLNISEDGVKYHMTNIHKKLKTQNRLAAVVKALHNGLINI